MNKILDICLETGDYKIDTENSENSVRRKLESYPPSENERILLVEGKMRAPAPVESRQQARIGF